MAKTNTGAVFIEVLPEERKLSFDKQESVLELLLEHDFAISHSCGGMGSCGTCLLDVAEPSLLPARTELELEMAQDRGFTAHERLACQTRPQAGLKIQIKNP